MSSNLIDAYQALLEDGTLRPDPVQAAAAERLQGKHQTLASYVPPSAKAGWLSRLTQRSRNQSIPRGLYLYGGPGRGKSMLMDLFFDGVEVQQKRRVHYHAFMGEVHDRINKFRQAEKAGKVPSKTDPLIALSRIIADRAWLLCFDEFHVTDIADAMILGRLFESLFDSGVVVVATSNRAPDDLYEGGLQRERFLPFIDLFKQKLDVLEMDGLVDHRLEQLRTMKVFLTPINEETDAELEKDFSRLILGMASRPSFIEVQKRRVAIPKTAEGVAFFSFGELCGVALGAADYLAIAARFHTVLVSHIPKLRPANRDSAKRFVTLIDSLYEHKVNLVCSAEVEPNQLYTEGVEAFEFERTVSRLIEMQSEEYIATPHVS